MERLVNDLLILARFDEGSPLQIVPTELVGLVAEAVHTAATVGPQWPVQFTASHPVEVMGDPTRLRQVVDNLLANVRAHTPEGTTATVRVEQEGATAEIVVKDTGPGMPQRRGRPCLRALLPGGRLAGTQPGWQRSRAVHRRRHRRRARRHGLGRVLPRAREWRSPCACPLLPLPRSRLRRTGPRPADGTSPAEGTAEAAATAETA